MDAVDTAGPDAVLSVRNVVPATFLRARFAACHTVTPFSATLGPEDYQRDLLGLPQGTARIHILDSAK